ncbi:thiol reductant ABC exporter subunit CydC [Clostridium algoriphilum]|uniref:thiol reductant ABC exporter subunit CydC n=1 Tax=Clostridium algoriphilum TaxID=198347 RepID=UPI001CF4EFBC|nr:thiol reductant ABC exporter subunit CydC [Clostridium algoriphilum]MCB2294757.1 thiol reductant ABC exporter subunit CydC [Clostridium algoriphilum]
MRIFKVMNALMKKQFFFVLLSIVMGVFTILANVGLLSTSAVLLSRSALRPDVLDLIVLIVIVRFFGISRGVFRYAERIFSHNTTLKMLSGIRSWFFKNFNENYTENTIKFKTGDIYSKIVNDVDVLKDFYLRVFYPLIIAILTGIITTVFISYFSMKVSIIYICFYIFSGFVLPVILFKWNEMFSGRERELKNDINLTLLDILKGIVEVQIYNLKDEFTEKFISLNKELSKLRKKQNIINTLVESINSVALSLLIVLTLMLTAVMVGTNKLSGIYYSMLPLMIMASFEAIIPMSLVVYKFNDSYSSGENIFSIIDSNSHKPKNLKNKTIASYDISVNNLSIKDKEHYIIKELSFELPYKKKIAIVGKSGCGKSTLLKAMLGYIKYQIGDVFIDGDSYKNLQIDDIRKVFTYVDQTPYTFNTTIKENLLIANTEATADEINKVLNKVQIMDLIKELPEGLNTLLGQYGYNLSGGEIKRLIIARAILKSSEIILLDEPTASLDIKTEKKVVQELHDLIKDKSCIWVTHKLVNMEVMDEILVMDEGSIVERGTHIELLNKNGLYYELWNMQKQYLNI